MQSIRSSRHVWSVVQTLRRYGIFSLLQTASPGSKLFRRLARNERYDEDQPRGARVREALEELGPVFIKFGQLLSTRPDLIPRDITDELTMLQDRVPPFDNDTAHAIIAAELNKPVDEIFSSIDDEVMASASIAQVYGATLKDGKEVVIKVVRPSIGPRIARDIETLYALAGLFNRFAKLAAQLRLIEVVKEFEDTLHDELDMLHEAGNASQLRANFVDSPLLYVPEVYFDYCSTKVLVMERVHAISVRDIEAIDRAGIDRKMLGHNGVIIFFTQAFKHGFFHADMHPGNVMVAADGRYMAVDFGIMGTLSERDQHYLAENFIAFFNRDYKGVAEAHIRSGWVPSQTRLEEFEGAIRTVCEPIFARPIAEISFGHFIVRLLQVARRFGIEIQPQLVLLEKTLMQIEGLGRVLYPQLDLWQTAKPFLEEWMDERVGVEAAMRQLKREVPRWATIVPQMPGLVFDTMTSVRDQQRLLHGQGDELRYLRQQMVRQNQNLIAAIGASALAIIGAMQSSTLLFTCAAVLGLFCLYRLIRPLP